MRLRGVPVLILFILALGALMAVPALHAALERDWRAARLFLYSGLFVMAAAGVLGAAARKRPGEDVRAIHARAELLTLLGVFAAAPVFAAIPIALLTPELGWSGAYFEAVSCLTTTGATLFSEPGAAPPALHLWRAMLGWIGGLVTLAAAAAILAPRELLDLPGAATARAAHERVGRVLELGPGGPRLLRAGRAVLPIYAALTLALALALMALGSRGLPAASHAMGVMATSGISPLPGGLAAERNLPAEMAAAVFLVLAALRLTYGRRGPTPGPGAARGWTEARRDPEVRLFAFAAAVAALWLFVHGVWARPAGAAGALDHPTEALHALWGSVFASVSFLSTAGYVSADWTAAAAWTRVEAPALMLMGLATLGGGVATTAGGVKLFRAYALYRHGGAELARLPHPSMVDVARTSGGKLTRQAIVNAWVYVMLYMVAAGVALMALTLTGLAFDRALAGAVAAMSNTGPLFPLATGLGYAEIPEAARWVMLAAMILGRIEVLAAVALLNPAYWRR
ncbi:MAG: potassium transporter TrkG [Pseudomonadota bacterium]